MADSAIVIFLPSRFPSEVPKASKKMTATRTRIQTVSSNKQVPLAGYWLGTCANNTNEHLITAAVILVALRVRV